MTEESTRREVLDRVKAIRQAQKRIKQKIKQILHILELLEDGTYPINQPWISLRRVTRVEDLRAKKHTTLRSALMADLEDLKALLESLKNDSKTLRRELFRRKTRRMRRRARRSERDFKRWAEEILKEAEKEGYLSDEEVEKLRAEAEDVVDQWADVLDRDPSRKNIEKTLGSMYTPLAFGSDPDKGKLGKAMDSLKQAGRKRANRARARFEKTPTRENAKRLFNSGAESQVLGGEEDDLWDTVQETAGKRAGNAERRFRRNQTVRILPAHESHADFLWRSGRHPVHLFAAGISSDEPHQTLPGRSGRHTATAFEEILWEAGLLGRHLPEEPYRYSQVLGLEAGHETRHTLNGLNPE
ncbi:MAG: hypothetical protein V3V49_00580 [Candidatus Krumholzibacteria bacterium]